MAIDYETFLQWAKDRFGEDAIKIKNTSHGIEILTHSFYAHQKGIEDYTYNLWMCPSGGRSKHPEQGSFRCWKTDTMGSLVRLVADYDCIPFEDAEILIGAGNSLRELERKVHEYFGHKEEVVEMEKVIEEPIKGVSLPSSTYYIDTMGPHFMKNKAIQYLKERKISTTGFYVCVAGEYKNRIIIPYFDSEDNLIWFNARFMGDKKGVIKYMKCKSDGLKMTQEDVLYMTSWPKSGSKIYIMEGEFDAKSVSMAGFVGCAVGGKFMSDSQIEMIRQYEPVLAFDADEGFKKDSGLQAMISIGKSLLQKGFSKISYVRPPKAYKDWNKLLVEKDADTIKKYIDYNEKPFTSTTPTMLLAQNI